MTEQPDKSNVEGLSSSEQSASEVQDLRVLPYQLERDAYEMDGRCVNCGWRGVLLIAKGEEAPGRTTTILGQRRGYCNECGCRGLTTRMEDTQS